MSTRVPLAILVILSFHARAFSQDSLFYRNGSVIAGQVEEIGLDQVRYRTNSAGNQVQVVVAKQDLSGIKLQGGQIYFFGTATIQQPYSSKFLRRKHAISLDLFAPALDHMTVAYEQVLGTRTSFMAKVGYIGLWDRQELNDPLNSEGVLIGAGVRLNLPRSARRTSPFEDEHALAGWYLRPEILFSAWTRTRYGYSYYDPYIGPSQIVVKDKNDYISTALVVTIGHQLFLSERFVLDFSGGLGYGMQWRDGKETNVGNVSPDRQEYSFTHVFFGESTPLVVSGGVRLGYAF